MQREIPVTVRPARLTDAQVIADLCTGCMGYPTTQQEVEGRLQLLLKEAACCILVAEIQGRAVGYIHACNYQTLYTPSLKNILGLAVFPDCRRMGAASALLAAVERWAQETGAAAVRLVSGEGRTGAHAFYRAQGYSGEKRQLNFKKPVAGRQP